MHPSKTAIGQQVLKDRSVALTPRQRAAFILIDGKRSVAEVLQQTAAAGVRREDIDQLLALGLVAEAAAPEAPPVRREAASPKDRYAAAYPLASQLTLIWLGVVEPSLIRDSAVSDCAASVVLSSVVASLPASRL